MNDIVHITVIVKIIHIEVLKILAKALIILASFFHKLGKVCDAVASEFLRLANVFHASQRNRHSCQRLGLLASGPFSWAMRSAPSPARSLA